MDFTNAIDVHSKNTFINRYFTHIEKDMYTVKVINRYGSMYIKKKSIIINCITVRVKKLTWFKYSTANSL